MTFQQVILVGNVGRDAELKYTPQGIAVADFSIAVSKRTGKGEQRQEETTWFKVTLWRERAENLSQYIKKGKRVMVVGEVKARAYTNNQGQAAASLEVTANEVRLLDSRSDEEGGGGGNYGGGGARGGNSGGGDAEDVNDIPF